MMRVRIRKGELNKFMVQEWAGYVDHDRDRFIELPPDFVADFVTVQERFMELNDQLYKLWTLAPSMMSAAVEGQAD